MMVCSTACSVLSPQTPTVQKAVESCRKEMEAELTEARNKYAEEATKRRKVHNKLMELQGNIRVFCRVRPQSESESKRGEAGELCMRVEP